MSWIDDWKKDQKQKDDQNRRDQDALKNVYIHIAESVQPMIERYLLELGESLWGRKFSKSILKDSFRWRWSIEKKQGFFDGSNEYIAVSLESVSIEYKRDDDLYLNIYSVFQESTKTAYTPKGDISEDALKKALIDVCKQQGWHPK